MTPKEPARLVEEYDAWHQNVNLSGAPAHIRLEQWHKDALSLSPLMSECQVLEVGCGQGDFAIHLSRLARSVSAIDFSPAAIAIARRKQGFHSANVEFDVGDAQALPFNDCQFDLLFSCECLEHLPDPGKALREMGRVLKPGGNLILTTENYSNAMVVYWLMAKLRGVPFNSGVEIQPIEQFFLFWKVRRLITAAGLRTTHMKGAHHVFFAIPGIHPHLFVREKIHTPIFAWLLRPFARHMSFRAEKL